MSKMMRVFLGVAVMLVVGYFSSNKVMAAGPWDDVWMVIGEIQGVIAGLGEEISQIQEQILGLQNNDTSLQEQIDGIELIPGPTGVPGPQGEPGVSFTDLPVYINQVDVPLPPNNVFGGVTGDFARCNSGDRMLSGGAQLNADGARILANRPQNHFAWYAAASNQDPVGKMLTVYVYCVDIP